MSNPPFLRQRKTKDPCQGCFLHKNLCICDQIPSLDLSTKIILVIHAKELKRTTNTGRLALKALTNSEMWVRGSDSEALDLSPILQNNYQSYLLYPSEQAIDLSEIILHPQKPIQLIVPDGNWRQASKVHRRHPELQQIPHVKMNTKNTAHQHLRKEHFAEGLSTLEAIAIALGLIEGPQIEESLTQLYQAKLNGTLKGRGIRKTS